MNTLCIIGTPGVLPEGPIWDNRTDVLLWVDINAGILGGRTLDITPNGTIARSVESPATCPTSCCFGGAKMDTLFITTSTHLLELDHRESLAGRVLALSGEGRGSRITEFKSGIGK